MKSMGLPGIRRCWWKILKQSEGQLLATNAYALLTSDYFLFSKKQCAVFKGTDRAVFLDKREYGLSKPRFQEFDNMFRVELFRNNSMMESEKKFGESSEKSRR